ncbi:MAG TPA: hypothetical protein VNI77_08645 [Nitrososphaera sp.]|nr:hypothetical protein [Nitrososphaera sp.]
MNDEQRKPTPEALLQTKDRVLEQWRLLPAEHQATMLLVLLKEIDSDDISDWTRNAVATLYPPPEQTQLIVSVPLVTREKLAQLDIAEQVIATLTDEDLKAIAGRIETAFSHEEFWNEVFHQALEFHTEQVLLAKRLKPI